MFIQTTLDKIHSKITASRWLQLFTAFTRCLLAVGFIPPSIPKILHKPFTVLPDSNPVGHYFNALYGTGFYYEFIGWAQLTAALLLLFPRTAHIGALLFLPIIANIAVLTTAVGFVGTWVITIFMLFAALWLTVWEFDRIKPIIFFDRSERTSPFPMQFLFLPLFFGLGGAAMAFVWWTIRLGNFSDYTKVGVLLIAVGSLFGFIVTFHYKFMPVGKLAKPPERLQ